MINSGAVEQALAELKMCIRDSVYAVRLCLPQHLLIIRVKGHTLRGALPCFGINVAHRAQLDVRVARDGGQICLLYTSRCV